MGTIKKIEKPISHEEYVSGKYKNTVSRGSEHWAVVWTDDGNTDESKTYSDKYLREHRLGKYAIQEKQDSASPKENKVSASKISGGGEEGCIIKFIGTITLLLPIWWLGKLIIKSGKNSLILLWWLVKLPLFLVTWPIRVFSYCCLSKDQRRGWPKLDIDVWPKYSFKNF